MKKPIKRKLSDVKVDDTSKMPKTTEIKSGKASDDKIVEEYQKIYLDSIAKFGPKTAVLMQCGGFYELYDCCQNIDLNLDEEFVEPIDLTTTSKGLIINNMHHIADFLGILVVKNKDRDIGIGNPHKAGFALNSKPRFVNRLIDENYNVIIVDEFPNEDEKITRKVRKVTEVITPGVQMYNIDNYHSNNVLVIYIENQNPKQHLRRIDKYELSIGLAAIDVTTNESYVYELSSSHSKIETINTTLEEVYRFIQSNRCRELVVHLNNFYIPPSTPEIELAEKERIKHYFHQTLELDRYCVRKYTINETPSDYTQSKFQNRELKKVYGDGVCGIGTTPLEFIDLHTRPIGCCALVLLFEFIRVRNEHILTRLSKPMWWSSDNELVLSHNSIEQLDLIPKTSSVQQSLNIDVKYRSLFNIINHTATAIGKRLLEQHLVHPLIDADKIEFRYSIVDEIRIEHLKTATSSKVFGGVIGTIRKHLKSIGDLQRLHRKIELSDISPSEVSKLMTSYKNILDLIATFQSSSDVFKVIVEKVLPTQHNITALTDLYQQLEHNFNVDVLCNYNTLKSIDCNIFKTGVNSELDGLCEEISTTSKSIDVLLKRCNDMLEPATRCKGKGIREHLKNVVTLREPHKGGKYFTAATKYRGLLKHYQNEVTKKFRDLKDDETPPHKLYEKIKVKKYNNLFHFIKEQGNKICDKGLQEFINKNMHKINKLQEINSDEDEVENEVESEDAIEVGDDYSVADSFLSPKQIEFVHNISFGELKSQIKIFSPLITQEESKTDEFSTQLSELIGKCFVDFIQSLYEKFEPIMKIYVDFVASIDVFTSHAITAIKYNYHRPRTIPLGNGNPSYIRIKNARHPIIERIQTNIPYVPNDISLGTDGIETTEGSDWINSPNGLFLFSINNGGKSSLLKALGLNVILAQIGSFVPATECVYRPFKNIITRLSGNDNMWKAQGSFAVEMSELRTVMNQSTPNSLILGDEICHGTEQRSALAIVGASAIRLCEKKTNFIFSTHLRLLPYIPQVKNIPNLQFAHFLATPDPVTEEIIYEYKLTPGLGESMYGIEIAESMGVEKEMCAIAYELRKCIEEKIVIDESEVSPTRKSVYNSQVYIDKCGIPECNKPVEETHHIKPQCSASDIGQIEHFHKNDEHNLVGLCKDHHRQITHSSLDIEGYQVTSKGIQLKIKR